MAPSKPNDEPNNPVAWRSWLRFVYDCGSEIEHVEIHEGRLYALTADGLHAIDDAGLPEES